MAGTIGRFLSRLTTRSAKTAYLSRQPYLGMVGGASSLTGVDVTPASAMSLSAVFAATQAIAYDVAGFPLLVYRHLDRGGKERLKDHPLAYLLQNPNPEMVEFDCRVAVMVGALLYGNGYAEIVRSGDGRGTELWPIESWRVTPMRDGSGKLYYQVDGVQLRADQVFHLKGLTTTGVLGLLTTHMGRETFGLALAFQKHSAAYFGNGARPGGVISHKGNLSLEAAAKLRDQWAAVHGGTDNGFKTAVLEEGMEWKPEGANPEESQLLQSRQFSVVEVARYFNVSPLRLGELGRATWSNLEESNSAYVAQTLTPWVRKIEQTANKLLLLPSEQGTLFTEHSLDSLLRAKTQERYVAYQSAINAGCMTRNEVRSKENLPPLDGLDEPVLQGAMVSGNDVVEAPATDATLPTDPPKQDDPTQDDPTQDDPTADPVADPNAKDQQARALVKAQLPLLVSEVRRLLRVESDKVLRSQKRGDLPSFVDTFYPSHTKVVRDSLLPVVRCMASSFSAFRRDVVLDLNPLLNGAADRLVSESRSDLTPDDGLTQRVEGWDARADAFAQWVGDELLSLYQSKVK
jgi:HK97 family phage portal protein